jgi:hypothetical protein
MEMIRNNRIDKSSILSVIKLLCMSFILMLQEQLTKTLDLEVIALKVPSKNVRAENILCI